MNKIESTKQGLEQNLDKLIPFSVVARLGSLSYTAKEIHLSQSALSHLITNLENALSIKLFRRKSHGLELTDAGSILFEFSKGLIADVETLAARLHQPQNLKLTSVRIGTHETLAAHIWPKVISRLLNDEPELKIALSSGRVDRLVEMLKNGELHATVTVQPKPDDRLILSTLYTGNLEIFVGMKTLRGKNVVSIKDIRGLPLFTDMHAHVMQNLPIPVALHRLGLDGSSQYEVASFEAAINLAQMNLGVAVLPDRNAATAVSKGRIRPIRVRGVTDKEMLKYQICLATLKNKNLEWLHSLLNPYFQR